MGAEGEGGGDCEYWAGVGGGGDCEVRRVGGVVGGAGV